MPRTSNWITAAWLAMVFMTGCGDDSDGNETTTAEQAASDGTAANDASSDGTTAEGAVAASPADGQSYAMNCEEVAALFKSEPTDTADDWTGFWYCYQENNNCSGQGCSFEPESLPDYVLSGDCASASTCTIDGETVEECVAVTETGYADFDCSTDGSMVISVNGLPDHRFENYAPSGTIPPLLGSQASSASYTFSTAPTLNSQTETPTAFDSPGGTFGVAVNGVAIFNQFTGISSIAVTDETVDDCGGHPANGTYHYHALPVCGFLADDERMGSEGNHSGLMGLWLDGFPVLGPYGFDDPSDGNSTVVRLESCYAFDACDDATSADCYRFDAAGYESGACHLDLCNGRETAVPEALQPALGERIYAYYTTIDADGAAAFPYFPFCYQSDVATSTGGSMGGAPPAGGPPPRR